MKKGKRKEPIKKARINLSNIKGFIQGSFRKLKEDILSLPLENHIKEQIEWRAIKAFPCVENGACLYCGCNMPEKLYEDRGCSRDDKKGSCYPDMMNKEDWEKFKLKEEYGMEKL